MERGMKMSLRAGLLLLAAMLTLAACDNMNMLGKLTTEVQKATGKLLTVMTVTPSHTSANVNPGARMTVTFDRAINMDTVNNSTVTISPVPTALEAPGFHLDFQYNDATKTLYIDSDPWLGDSKDYTLTITTAVKGADGSVPEKNFSWSFTTGIAPKGNLKVEADAALTNKVGATKILAFDLSCDNTFYSFRVAGSEAGIASATWNAMPGGNTSASANTTAAYYFPAGTADGLQTVYYQFKNMANELSTIRSDTITLDQTPPTVSAGPDILVNGSASAVPGASASDLNGIAAYAWTWSPSSVTCSPSANVLAPTFLNPGADNSYTGTLTATDKAGNTNTDSMILRRDGTPPNAVPVFDVMPSSPTTDPTPTWSWHGTATSGGEATRLFTYRLNYYHPIELTWKPYFVYTQKVTSTSYTPQFAPGKTLGLFDVRYQNTIYEPIQYRMSVWETDLAANLSAVVTSTDLAVNSVAPYNGQTGVGLTPTLTWRTLYDPYGRIAEYYVLHFGQYAGAGEIKEIWAGEIAQPKTGNPSWMPSKVGITLKAGVPYGWFVDSKVGRSPTVLVYKADCWVFTP